MCQGGLGAVGGAELAPPDVGIILGVGVAGAGIAGGREEDGEVGGHDVVVRVGGVPDGDEVGLGRRFHTGGPTTILRALFSGSQPSRLV